ncbi:MAG: hypothetical protein ABIZ04_17165 [Opitutus sp.]
MATFQSVTTSALLALKIAPDKHVAVIRQRSVDKTVCGTFMAFDISSSDWILRAERMVPPKDDFSSGGYC